MSFMFCVCSLYIVFFFKQKTAYEMRISDWSSDVCSSDLGSPDAGACASGNGLSWPGSGKGVGTSTTRIGAGGLAIGVASISTGASSAISDAGRVLAQAASATQSTGDKIGRAHV